MNKIDESTLARDPSTLYHLEGDSVDWHTGFDKDGGQLLVNMMSPNDLILRFSPDGRLEEVAFLPDLFSQSSDLVSEQDEQALQAWLIQVGFRPGLIAVRKFAIPEHHMGISDLPFYYQDILLNPNSHSQDERDFAHREFARWLSEGLFEFSLREHLDFWIDESGQIVAT